MRDELLFLAALHDGTTEALAPYVTKLIVPRRDEEPELLARRRALFTYHNHIASAIRELVSKFSTGTYSVSDDAKVLDEKLGKAFIIKILKEGLRLGAAYVVVEPHVRWQNKVLNRSQQEYATSALESVPAHQLVTVYTKLQVEAESVNYIRLLASQARHDDDGTPYTVHEMRIITPDVYRTARWHSTNQRTGTWEYRLPGGSWQPERPEPIWQDTPGDGVYPVLKLDLEDLCVTRALKHLQIDDTRIRNAMLANAYAAGHIQPWVTPVEETSALPTELQGNTIKTGSAYTVKAQKFEFAETTGKSTEMQLKVLQEIKQNVRQAVGLSGLSFEPGSEMSGIAKAYEMAQLTDTMKTYGARLLELYQRLLRFFIPTAHVHGFDEFELDNAVVTLTHLKMLHDANVQLPTEVMNELISKLAHQLLPNSDHT
jgi:hypothetical protein